MTIYTVYFTPSHSPKTNAIPHCRKNAIFKFDIEAFFPNIRPHMVYCLFANQLACTPDVSRILTRLTTLDGGVPQGSPTSTIIANHVIFNLAIRIKKLADIHECDYTQFVDDGTISGSRYIERLRTVVEKIIKQEGFKASQKPGKRTITYAENEQIVTGIRVNSGIDVSIQNLKTVREEIEKLENEIKDGKKPSYKRLSSLRGKIQYISQLNPGAAKCLKRKIRIIEKNYNVPLYY